MAKDNLWTKAHFTAAAVGIVVIGSCGGADVNTFRVPVDVIATDLQLLEADSAVHSVLDMTYDGIGRVWILSGFEPFLHVWDLEGGEVVRLGRRGQGPGELRVPWYFVDRFPTGAPAVWDVGNRRVVEFDLSGDVVREVSVESNIGVVVADYRATSFGTPLKVVELGSNLVVQAFDEPVVRSGDLWNGMLLHLGGPEGATDTIVRFATLEGWKLAKSYSLFGPGPLWVSCGGSRIGVLNPSTRSVVWFDPTGTQLDQWQLDLPRIPVSKGDVSTFIRHSMDAEARDRGQRIDLQSAEIVRFMKQALAAVSSSVPEEAPPVGLECDEQGRVWVQLFSTDFDARGYGSHWVVTDGEVGHVVEFPRGFQPLRFARGRALGYWVDDLGVQWPAIVSVPITTGDGVDVLWPGRDRGAS
jgi:hypothetical protein